MPLGGVGEEVVTGFLAHRALRPYWVRASARTNWSVTRRRRVGGTVRVPNGDRVDLLGRGITIMRGTPTA
ncbi:MAG: hypothetical protein U0232_23095 [Thermomicrobiales bacterium]